MRIIITLALACLLLATAASAFTIKAETGETYIRWQWSSPNSTYDIYVDGELRTGNTTISYVYLNGLGANEEHRLDVMDVSGTTPLKTSIVKTNAPALLIIIVLVVALGLTVLIAFLEGWIVILLGAVVEAFSIFGRAISCGFFGVDWLFLVIMAVTGYFVAKAIYEIGKGEIAWY